MKNKVSNCNRIAFFRGLRLFLSDFVCGYRKAWQRSFSVEMQSDRGYGFMEILVTITQLIILGVAAFTVFHGVIQLAYWLGMLRLHFEGSIDVSSAPLWWIEKSAHQEDIVFAGFPGLFKLILLAGFAYGCSKFVSRICKRGQPGASKMFDDA